MLSEAMISLGAVMDSSFFTVQFRRYFFALKTQKKKKKPNPLCFVLRRK